MTDIRKLATILSIDVVGYSRSAENDESAAVADVRRLRSAVSDIVAPFGGRIFNTAGDGFMVEFSAASSGVQAALALLSESQSGARPLPRIRVGLHLGEVVVEDNGDLLGHGVNVAARLQAQAEAGSALVSETVRAQLRSVEEISFTPQGRVQLDKMSERLAVYALSPGRAPLLGKIARRRLARTALVFAVFVISGFIVMAVTSNRVVDRQAAAREHALSSLEGVWGRQDRNCQETLHYAIETGADGIKRVRVTGAGGYSSAGQVVAVDDGVIMTRNTTPSSVGAREQWEFRPQGDRLVVHDKDGVATILVRCDIK